MNSFTDGRKNDDLGKEFPNRRSAKIKSKEEKSLDEESIEVAELQNDILEQINKLLKKDQALIT